MSGGTSYEDSTKLLHNADKIQLKHGDVPFFLELQENVGHVEQLLVVFQALEEKAAGRLQRAIETRFTLL